MIDWFGVLANGLWIFALALALAVLSDASWQATLAHEKLNQRLALWGKRALLDVAGVFFSLGLAATAQGWWEHDLWLLFSVIFVIRLLAIGYAHWAKQRLV